jgi:hypothetical protein
MKNVPRGYIFILAAVILVVLAFVSGLLVGDFVAEPTVKINTVEVTRIVKNPLGVDPGQRLLEVQVTRIVERKREIPILVEVTRIVEQQVGVPVEVTRVVVEIIVEEVMAEPPEPRDALIELSGASTFISANYIWNACNKLVFYGYASASQGDFIVHLWDANCTGSQDECMYPVFNMSANDGEIRGESLLRIPTGTYYLEIESIPDPPTTWTLAAECQS